MKFYVMIVYAMSVLLTADWLEAVSSRQAFISFRTASSALRSNHRRGNDDIKVNTITAKVNNHTTSVSSDIYDWRLALAGGLAGGLSNAIIYPIDTVKTMMQTDRNLRKFPQVLKKLRTTGYSRLYAGVTPAVVGSIPSSMLYFGSYEFMKRWLAIHMPASVSHFTPIYRPSIHFIAAACGNLVSSIVFVPKEVIKQQLQAYRTGSLPWNTARAVSKINSWTICKIIYAESGIKGFFPSYKATLARNIPSAMVSRLQDTLFCFDTDMVVFCGIDSICNL